MNTTDILLIINSVLLGLITLPFLLIAYFLKDLHKDFKSMMERVNKMNTELHTHVSLFNNLAKVFQKQIDALGDRIKRLEKFFNNQKIN